MPIYEYKCLECGSHIEKRQKISDEPLKVCDECGGALEKQWSLSGFQFKGAGWYVTDYANKKTDKVASSSDETKTEKTSEAKPTETKETASGETASKKTSESNSKKDTVSKKD